ncbi:putative transcriptional regulator [Candidatus Nitrososphaera evergladensis SR1]|uniref:Putative transcriptional regulator n=1 Tax=Candidatus Nitrososphaera evergladensis SR1 TaxID=1459636 RepID=A0A075MV30_9ARCH|nr:helix-turn-helix domain-containing protein [Candidatus Nitrososphaera evergladensis]AIF83144.1 putative transcriptional regulator [Candidatus Nitrososphaera evergladensis SR1]
MLEQQLVDLGLTQGEARVFLSLLKLGPSKVGAVVKDSKVSYSKVYDVLERLASKGLVSHATIGNIKHFNAVEPYRLHDYLQKKEDALKAQKATAEGLVSELAKVANRNRAAKGAEIFAGDRGLRTAYEILLKDASKNDVLRYFYPFDDYHPIATPFYSRLHLFQKEKEITQRGIGTVAFSRSAHYREIAGMVDMRFVPFPLPGTMDVFQDKLLMVSWESEIGILVTSKDIADHFARYFDSVWQVATISSGTRRRSRQ